MKNFLEKKGHWVRTSDVVQEKFSFIDTADMIGIVYPVWGSSVPEPYWDLIPKMKYGNGKKLFLVGNCGAFTGDTGMYWKKRIEKQGYDVFYIDHIVLPVNVNVPGFNIWKVPQGKKKNKMFRRAELKLQQICRAILDGKQKVDGIGPGSRLGGWSQRAFFRTVKYWKKMFMIDHTKCIKCRLCERMCPMNNIHMDNVPMDINHKNTIHSDKIPMEIIHKDNIHIDNNFLDNMDKCKTEKKMIEDKDGNDVTLYTINMNTHLPGKKDNCFGPHCILCLKCYNLCPYDAVLIGGKSRDTKKYRRYKGPSADFKPVLYR